MDHGHSRLLLELYRAAREATLGAFEDRALNLVKPLLGFERSMWGMGDVTPAGLEIHNVHLHELPEEFVPDYEEFTNQDPVVVDVFKRRGQVVNFYAPKVYAGRDNLGIHDLVKHFKIQNMLITATQSSNNFIQWVALYRADPDRHYSERERLLCESLVPHMMEALTINRAIHLDRVGIEPRRYARGFADRKGVLQFAEPKLTALLQSEWPAWSESLLPSPLLDAFVTGSGTRFRGREIAVRAVWQNGLLYLGARRRCAADGLSPRELEVARHIAAGLSYKEIARKIDIAPATARNHTQAIYGKLEVSNKAKLIAELNLIADD